MPPPLFILRVGEAALRGPCIGSEKNQNRGKCEYFEQIVNTIERAPGADFLVFFGIMSHYLFNFCSNFQKGEKAKKTLDYFGKIAYNVLVKIVTTCF